MWTTTEKSMEAILTFTDFKSAFSFMTEVAFVAEQMNHHPEWTNTWNRVAINLTTHSAGNVVTEKDLILAKIIEEIYLKHT